MIFVLSLSIFPSLTPNVDVASSEVLICHNPSGNPNNSQNIKVGVQFTYGGDTNSSEITMLRNELYKEVEKILQSAGDEIE